MSKKQSKPVKKESIEKQKKSTVKKSRNSSNGVFNENADSSSPRKGSLGTGVKITETTEKK